MRKRFLIIDGHNLLFQMFYGLPTRIVGKDNKPINAILGFVAGVLKLSKLISPTHLVVVFDSERENERAKINPEYKANRTDYSLVGEEDSPFSQLNDVYRALDFMSVKHFEALESETDDVISAYVSRYKDDCDIFISSFDSDFFQLIDENVFVIRYRGKSSVICDKGYIKQKFGIFPHQYADFKSLTGDGSDNIKGAAKVGVKTAATLLNEFNSLENILEKSDKIAKNTVRKSIIQNKELVKNNYKIIKLNDNAKLNFELEDLKMFIREFTTTSVLEGIGVK